MTAPTAAAISRQIKAAVAGARAAGCTVGAVSVTIDSGAVTVRVEPAGAAIPPAAAEAHDVEALAERIRRRASGRA